MFQERFTKASDWQMMIASLEKQIQILKQTGIRGKQKLRLTQLTRKGISTLRSQSHHTLLFFIADPEFFPKSSPLMV